MNLGGRTVLLTGATGGIGVAIAEAVAAQGGKLVVTGRRTALLEPLAARLGGRAITNDLADPGGVDALLEDPGARDADVLVANAALPASGRIGVLSREEIDDALTVNLRAPILLAQALAARMIERGSAGQLVFVSSLSGKAASSGGALYSATKFGLRGFALGLREDLRPHGIGVSIVAPGFIRDAGMFHNSGAKLPPGVGTRTPQQVATAVLKAIEHDRAEVEVAPLAVRLGATFAGFAPEASAALQRRLGSDGVSEAIAEGHRSHAERNG